jgi:TonB-dependent Receptor Plug Domain
MKRAISIISMLTSILSLCYLSAYSQVDHDVLKNVVSKLTRYASNHVSEKAYLHFDKPYYAAGDTIYFKAYVTFGERHRPSKLSGVLHVDLINTNNKIDQSIKLQIIDGITWGDFALPDSLPKGNYRVRAYTQWMRNDGNYFDQTIPVGSTQNNKIPESSTAHTRATNTKQEIQFFPEGGELVTGIPSKVAFKAIGVNGLGVDVKGVIEDNTGTEVSKFIASHLGMGYFYLKPEQGKTYRAKVNYSNGVQSINDLPLARDKGIILKIDNDNLGAAPLQIIANESYLAENHDKAINLFVYSGGIANMLTITLDTALINLTILKRHLLPGITRVTLFSQTGEPLCERLIFIQKPDQLRLTINTDKETYAKREKVHFSIHAVNQADSVVAGHFSVSVIDESKVPVDENSENTINNYLLLTSELKGYVEQPNYYFTDVTDKTRADLELVMLTHGYRRFEWKQLLNDSYPPVAYQPESDLEIAGTAKSLFGKPLANARVSLISMQGGAFKSETANNKGRFRFSDLVFTDTGKFVLQAVNAKGRKYTKLTYDNDVPEPAVTPAIPINDDDAMQLMSAYMENNKIQRDDISKYGDPKGRVLKEVKIKEVKRKDDYRTQSLVGAGNADQVMHSDELDKLGGPFLKDKLLTKFYGRAVVAMSGLVVVDGASMPPGFNIDDLNASDVETVEAIYGANAAIYGMRAGGGVLVITTKQGKGVDPKDIASIGVLPIIINGFYKAREFYSPKYDIATPANNRRDLRATIFWKAELVTDKEGNASLDYYNADGTGTCRLVIEGIDEKGNIGRQVYRYKVLDK